MNWNKQTIEEWNQLGFYYEYDSDLSQWRFWGSKAGLGKFAETIRSYAGTIMNDELSEHIHLGPYNYLKIMTWQEPVITDKYIGGSLKELIMLSEIIVKKINLIGIGESFKISEEFSSKNSASLLFIIMANNFIPSSIEF